MIFHWHMNSESCERAGQHAHRPVSQLHGESILPRGQRPPFQPPAELRTGRTYTRVSSMLGNLLAEHRSSLKTSRKRLYGQSGAGQPPGAPLFLFFFFFNPSETLCQIRPQFRNFMYNNTTLGVVWVVEQNIC